MQIYLDISPVTADLRKRTGLARSALQLARSLATVPDVSMTLGGFGSVSASWNVSATLETDPLGRSAQWTRVSPGLSALVRLSESSSSASRNVGRACNLIRDPMAGFSPKSFDILHSTYARFPWRTRRSNARKLLTVHDLIPLKLPGHYFSQEQIGITSRIIRSIRDHDFVVCPSEATRVDLLEYGNHPEDHVSVIPWGVDHELFQPKQDEAFLEKMGLEPGRYFVTLSSHAPHKNLRFLIDCFKSALESINSRDFKLVLIGGLSDPSLLADIQSSRIINSIQTLGFVNDSDLPAILSGAAAFCFPSLYEGFGLPVLESMACGTPVIASDRGSLPEIIGDAGCCLDPSNREIWINELAKRMQAPSSLPDQTSLLNARKFQWSSTAERHVRLYRQIVGQA